jgi:DNA-binding winged helix-turn-helix (wHTH) protein
MSEYSLFNPFCLDLRNEQLWCDSQPITLRPKTFAVLRHLVAKAGQLVTQEAILDAVWGRTAVSETVVRSSIRELRAILGDRAQQPQFIQTVHRRGYRFIAPVILANTQHLTLSSDAKAPRQVALPIPIAAKATVLFPIGPPLDEEHKLVTVLCCAVTNAPALAAHRGPEAMHRLIQVFFTKAHEVIQRYEGTITHVTGEGFTALFDAPLGQEDHTRRAVLAALELGEHLQA